MEININLNKKNLGDLAIKSLIYNTILEVFKEKKGIDIQKYIISIKKVGKIFLVKTKKPIINTEAYLLNDIIKEKALQKINKLGYKLLDFEIKYK